MAKGKRRHPESESIEIIIAARSLVAKASPHDKISNY